MTVVNSVCTPIHLHFLHVNGDIIQQTECLETAYQILYCLFSISCNDPMLIHSVLESGPYLGILCLWIQENFAPPLPPSPLFVHIQLCVSKNNTKN
jgi:hypothetical protein